ncbi:MAG: hypothetical protein ACFFCD_01420 [Promethearchaeota archaeon]
MKAIASGESLDYETYEFIRDCGITSIVLLKFDLIMGPYIAFKGVYDHNVPIIEVLNNPEYLVQFYVGIAGTEMDVLEKNGERIIIAQQTQTIDATNVTDVLILCTDHWVSKTAASNLANELLKNSNAEPHLLEEQIALLKENAPKLKLQLKNIPKRVTLEHPQFKKMTKKQKLTHRLRFTTTPFAAFQQREFKEIELKFPTLKKSMFFIRISLEHLNIAHFFDTLLSHMELNKDTIFSIDVNKGHMGNDLDLTLVLPPNQRNFVERLAGALTMTGFSISLVRETELEDHWIAPLRITHGTSLKISRKHKDYIQVLGSPPRLISLFRSKTLPSLTITALIDILGPIPATIVCREIRKNKVAVEIILTKQHSEKAELDQFHLPDELVRHFIRVRGKRALTNAVKDLLLRQSSKGLKLSLKELKAFFMGELTEA